MIDVKKAKQKILDLAIRGELTKQLKSDGNAADLFVKIQKEKEKLIKDKTIKNDKNIINDNIEEPFEIPENWVWCKIGEIGIYRKGPFGSSLKKSLFVEKSKNTIKVYEQQNAINHNSSLGKYYISKDYFENKMKGFEVFSGDLIVSCAGTIGEIYLMPERIERGIINQALMKITLFKGVNKQYFIKYFDYCLKQSASEGNGSAIINIPPFEILKNYSMPLPPFEEQKRIVEKVEQLFDILDKIDEAQKKYQNNKEILKTKIIEAGIRGKLTKQLKTNGNASDLLDEIRKEKEKLIKEGKIKRDKKETYIYKNPKDNLYYEKYEDGTEKCIQEEIPFETPENWVWCKIESAVERIIAGGDKPQNIKYEKDEKHTVPVFSNGEKNEGLFGFTDKPKIFPPALTISARGTIGYTVFRDIPFVPIVRLITITSQYSILLKYISYYLKTYLIDSNGATTQQITIPMLTSMLIPLPPHAEQERIVSKIEDLLKSINF